ncbi:MAG: hypothetical protein G01um101420_704 [Parcubacteria group bacterium Gr01-1014_20]|nr:MAG: hypothetical protein G01um101420_704 [Parcubacteria group bacterium Gr01-1014_20]
MFGYMSHRFKDWRDCIVGFSTSNPEDPANPGKKGIIVIECPKCFANFWFHVWEQMIPDVIEAEERNKGEASND